MFKSNIETGSREKNSLTSSIGSRSIVNSCWHRQNVWSRGRCGCWDLARFGWRCGGHSWGFHQLWVADWFLAARVIRISLHGASLSQLVHWTSVPETNVILKTLETSLNIKDFSLNIFFLGGVVCYTCSTFMLFILFLFFLGGWGSKKVKHSMLMVVWDKINLHTGLHQ